MSDKGFQQCHDAARFEKASNTEMMIGQNYIGLLYEDDEDDDEDKDLEDPRNCMSRLVCALCPSPPLVPTIVYHLAPNNSIFETLLSSSPLT